MADIKAKYGSSGQTIILSLASLASGAYRASSAINNGTNLFLNALITLKVAVGSSAVANGVVNVYAYGTADSGGNYTGGVSGTDGTTTVAAVRQMKLIGTIFMTAAGAATYSGNFDIASAFGGPGCLPQIWGIAVENLSGGTLDATEANHTKFYQGLLTQAV